MSSTLIRFACIVLITCGPLGLAPTSEATNTAEKTNEEIVVTADLRQRARVELTSSVSVVGGEVAEKRNSKHLDDLLFLTPNVNYASGASRGRYIQVRGIGERGQFDRPLNSSVGLLIDGMDFSGIGGAGTLFDLDQLEVLRGPHGTLHGANALAGLVQLKTNDPTTSWERRVVLDLGAYNHRSVGFVGSGPVSDDVGFRIAYERLSGDGYIDNDHLNRSDTNGFDESTLRVKLRWDSDTTGSASTFHFGRIDIDNGYDAFSLDNVRTTLSDNPGQDAQLSNFVQFRTEGITMGIADLSANISWVGTDLSYGYDEDWVFEGFHPWEYASTDLYKRTRTSRQGELKLISNEQFDAANGNLDWLAGIAVFGQTVDLDRTYTYSGPFSSENEFNRTSVFGHGTIAVSNQVDLELGARWESSERSYQENADGTVQSFDPDTESNISYQLGMSRSSSNGSVVYGSVSSGYKPGGFNSAANLPASLRFVHTEKLTNFELGYRAQIGENLDIDLAFFTMRRTDVQVGSSIVQSRDDGSEEFIQYIGNAAEGSNSGVELESTLSLTPTAQVIANVGLLNTEYTDFTTADGEVLDGREQAHAPGWQTYIAFAKDIGASGYFQIEAEGRDDFFASDSHGTVLDGYMLINFSAGIQLGSFEVDVWLKNIMDSDYFVRGFSFGNDPRDGYTTRSFRQFGAPRRGGVRFSLAL